MDFVQLLTQEWYWGHSNDRKSSDIELLEIVYNSDESFSDSSIDNVSSSDNEISDIAVADAKQQL